ncbi:hypothetical protein SEA_STUBBY_6 [Mycobacterium phage Stubby]|uniref:Uncharacterized protein n=1 Tax=Mycobacterium phage Stubby TaxID=2510577 RepID=A0A411AYZ8_9CAUD|nr:hypothetical protein SEA_STUBBY_6 [Mycobacterium phage Stubby]
MTDTLLAPDLADLVDMKSQPACECKSSLADEDEWEECSHAATWCAVSRCCALTLLICDDHRLWYLDYVAKMSVHQSWVFICGRCRAAMQGNPFVSLERL